MYFVFCFLKKKKTMDLPPSLLHSNLGFCSLQFFIQIQIRVNCEHKSPNQHGPSLFNSHTGSVLRQQTNQLMHPSVSALLFSESINRGNRTKHAIHFRGIKPITKVVFFVKVSLSAKPNVLQIGLFIDSSLIPLPRRSQLVELHSF